jgi:hypothetical protein
VEKIRLLTESKTREIQEDTPKHTKTHKRYNSAAPQKLMTTSAFILKAKKVRA